MANKICGIYKIINLFNNKVYIGQSIDICNRLYEHKRKLCLQKHHNKHLQSAYNRYGEYFAYEIIEECSVSDLDKREMYWIGFCKSDNPKYGYNIMSGGQLNRPCAEQSKALISKPVLCIETGVIYPSIAEAQRVTGIGNISLTCNGKLYHSGGFHWCFEEDVSSACVEELLNKKQKRCNKKVVCIETGEVFESLTEAAKAFGITTSAISRSIKKNSSKKAFHKKSRPHWRYVDKEVDV